MPMSSRSHQEITQYGGLRVVRACEYLMLFMRMCQVASHSRRPLHLPRLGFAFDCGADAGRGAGAAAGIEPHRHGALSQPRSFTARSASHVHSPFSLARSQPVQPRTFTPCPAARVHTHSPHPLTHPTDAILFVRYALRCVG
eukprot:5545487-Pleurochrysis_carterae.AAC.1